MVAVTGKTHKGKVEVKSYKRHSKSGKLVDVQQYHQGRNLADDIRAASPDRPPIVAVAGQYPLGRSVPGFFPHVKAITPSVPVTQKAVKQVQTQLAQVKLQEVAQASKVVQKAGLELKHPPHVQSAVDKLRQHGLGVKPTKVAPAAKKVAAASKPKPVEVIAKHHLSNPDTPRTRAVPRAEFLQLAHQGQLTLEHLQNNSSPPTGLDNNWAGVQSKAWASVQQDWGGTSIDTHTGKELTGNEDLYALTVKTAGQGSVAIPIGSSQAQFNAAMDEARKRFAAQYATQQHYMGVFRDADVGQIQIDPVLVVDSVAAVESIGAFTHAVGGAYHFSDGLGYWPPHVVETKGVSGAKVQRVRQVAHGGTGSGKGQGGSSSGTAATPKGAAGNQASGQGQAAAKLKPAATAKKAAATPARPVAKGKNYATKATDKRTGSGQTRTNFVNELTGAPMGKTETGDTFEQLFIAKGKQLVEKKYGKFSLVTSAGGGGSRTTPLDLRTRTHGGELKSISSLSPNQKTAIKADEIQRKLNAVATEHLKPLLLVQVINQEKHTVSLHGMEMFGSKAVSKMTHYGDFTYTEADFKAAQVASGHHSKALGRAVAQGVTPKSSFTAPAPVAPTAPAPGFKHPVSGQVIPVPAGGELKKHNTSNSFIVSDAKGRVVRSIDRNGNTRTKVPTYSQNTKDTNYTKVDLGNNKPVPKATKATARLAWHPGDVHVKPPQQAHRAPTQLSSAPIADIPQSQLPPAPTNMTPAEQGAVFWYAEGDNASINSALRHGDKLSATTAQTQALAGLASRSRTTQDMTVYRGANRGPGVTMPQMSPGQVVTDLGFMSFSTDHTKAMQFARVTGSTQLDQNVLFAVSAPKGSPLLNVGGSLTDAYFKPEKEVLAPPGMSLHVISDKVEKVPKWNGQLTDQRVVRATLVPSATQSAPKATVGPNLLKSRKAWLKELDAQGVSATSPIRGVLGTPSSHMAIARDAKGSINGAIAFSVEKGMTQVSIHDVRVMDKQQGIGLALLQQVAASTKGLPREHKYTMEVYGAVDSAIPWYIKSGADFVSWSHVGTWSPDKVAQLKRGETPKPGKMLDANGKDVTPTLKQGNTGSQQQLAGKAGSKTTQAALDKLKLAAVRLSRV